jgi:hypothetical protein
MDISLSAVKYKNSELLNKVRQDATKKFGGDNSYVKNLWVLNEYKKRGGKVSYQGKKPSGKKIQKQIGSFDINDSIIDMIDEWEEISAAANEGKALNKPFRLPSGSKKKFGVYVKNDKGNIVKVTFGDPNMEIKRDDPERRKNYRARHNCDNPGPKWKANYWSCKNWSKKPVSKVVGSEIIFSFENEDQIDWDNLPEQKDILALDPLLIDIPESDDCGCDGECGEC